MVAAIGRCGLFHYGKEATLSALKGKVVVIDI
jgi:hypothetical protein